MSEMAERIARLLAEMDGIHPDTDACRPPPAIQPANLTPMYAVYVGPAWTFYQDKARQVIEAMREPTSEMGGIEPCLSCSYGHEGDDFLEVWRDMIDEALR